MTEEGFCGRERVSERGMERNRRIEGRKTGERERYDNCARCPCKDPWEISV